ncbi:hypothetical protein E2C01_095285 [Portunus trituberculatus]|uniref:Uncharacterized protein n=1 Tax=Portunus trituberculatus TaxID=210409 RepID=A0A5B7K5E0_PORTR|nr:hypothetical protein [Portunus trituberculatus]
MKQQQQQPPPPPPAVNVWWRVLLCSNTSVSTSNHLSRLSLFHVGTEEGVGWRAEVYSRHYPADDTVAENDG